MSSTPDLPDVPEPADTDVPGTSRPRSARSLLSLKVGGGKFVVATLVGVLGFAAVAQVNLTRTGDDFSGQRREDLIELLDSLSGAADRAQTQIDDLERARDDLLTNSERRQAALDEGTKRLEALRILTGTAAATGPGVSLKITDPSDSVTAASLLNGIEELRDAGAEAIEINDVVRVVASTSFTESGGVVSSDGVELRPPYVIDAIGSSHTLSEAVVFPGGFSDEIEELGGSVEVDEADVIEVGSLHTIEPPEYSQPTDG